MTYDYEVTLISQSYGEDEIGNQIPIEVETDILCGKKSVVRTEFYKAAAEGLRPEIALVIHPYEYSGQKKVRFEDAEYKVIRAYEVNMEEMELTCEKVIGNG
ncbi:gp16_SPP1: putative phage head-tail adaptor [Desulfitobacterium hafniense]|uniref:Gp16_SPP1: putative phage head-tail adaptor n=1 Tax=Desulfitobacterium hafniense TaxID=49338 RepID=A0A098AU87_DESHA|nr:phage head closure protein [Desulfitobacterium hafniense]CDV96355.1 gp16_SPP1: putative phage head-tail adaptor [Desulfitobacterium hafniense]